MFYHKVPSRRPSISTSEDVLEQELLEYSPQRNKNQEIIDMTKKNSSLTTDKQRPSAEKDYNLLKRRFHWSILLLFVFGSLCLILLAAILFLLRIIKPEISYNCSSFTDSPNDEFNKSTLLPTIQPEKPDAEIGHASRCCDVGWAMTGDYTRCVKVFEQDLNWYDAENFCRSQGSKLASIHNASDDAFILRLVRSTNESIQMAYLGATTSQPGNGVTSGWNWHDGTAFDYQNWARKQPDDCCIYDCHCCPNDSHQQCLQMWITEQKAASHGHGGRSGQWDDGCCHHAQPFICEKLAVQC